MHSLCFWLFEIGNSPRNDAQHVVRADARDSAPCFLLRPWRARHNSALELTGDRLEVNGRKYEIVRGSDVDRDGVYVELNDVTDQETKFLLEIFHSDSTGQEVLYAEKTEIPLEVLQAVLEVASQWLKPK